VHIWKVLGAAVGMLAAFVLGPYVLARYGVVSPLRPHAMWILFATAVGLEMKLFFSDLISDFKYHKHGYDLSTLTLGAALTGFALQITASQDLYPGIPKWFVSGPNTTADDLIRQRAAILAGLAFVACLVALVTARISAAIERDNKAQGKPLLAAINFVIGTSLFCGYLVMLVSKG